MYRLARAWYWRHLVVALEYNLFTGRGVYWCGRCGGTIRTVELGRYRIVLHSTCPLGRAYMRIQAPR